MQARLLDIDWSRPLSTLARMSSQLNKIREYVHAHIADRVLVADLCATVHLSKAHFSRAFKRSFGVSPHTFVLRCRLELAARLMVESSMSLAEIAMHCGFADQSHLCKRFRPSTGESPAAWRRARRHANVSADT